MKKILLLALSLLGSFSANALTCNSLSSNNWNTASTWSCGRVPTTADTAVIRNPHVVTLNANTNNIISLNVQSGGKLLITTNRVLNVAGTVTIGGTIEASTIGTNVTINATGMSVASTGLLVNNFSAGTTAININGNVTNAGIIRIYQNGNFNVTGTTSNTGTLDLSQTTLNFTTANLTNDSIVNFTNNLGRFTVTNNLTNNAGDTITLGLLSTVDTLRVGGTLTNNGTIVASTGIANEGTTGLANSAQDIKINNFVNNATGVITVSSSPNFKISGNFTNNNNSINLGRAYFTFNGTSSQTVSGLSRVYSLSVNNASGIVLSTPTLIGFSNSEAGQLYLLNGKITTSGTAYLGYTVSCERTMYRYKVPGSWVNGRFQLTFPNYAVSCTALIGNNNNYSPVTLESNAFPAPQAGNVIVEMKTGDHPNTTAGTNTIDVSKSLNEYLIISSSDNPSLFLNSKYKATINYCNAANTLDCTSNNADADGNINNFEGVLFTTSWNPIVVDSRGTNGIFRTITFRDLTTMGTIAVGEKLVVLTPICLADDFSGTLANWNVSGVGYTPTIVTVGTQKRLRLTDAVGNRATFAQYKRNYPGSGNKLVIEVDYYVYGGNGADGVTITLSDALKTPAPGFYGGSLGYSNGNGGNGFNGGWLSIGIDEFGNFPNPTENRRGYPPGWIAPNPANQTAGFYPNNVSVRGSGDGTNGYYLLANTGTLATPIWQNSNTSNTIQRFRITIDHSNNLNAYLTVERDTTGTGTAYSTIIPKFDVKGINSLQEPIPETLFLSFTGSTGGSTNIHEIKRLSVCSYYVYDPNSSVASSGFNCLEPNVLTTWNATARKPLYTKLTGTDFKVDIAALKTDGNIETSYVGVLGVPKQVKLELFDASTTMACTAYTSPIATQNLIFREANGGRITSNNFNINRAYKRVIARVTDSTNPSNIITSCSTDFFTIRPKDISVTSTNANADSTGLSDTGSPTIKAGDNFNITASTDVGYDGTPFLNNSLIEWPNKPTWGRTNAENGVGTTSGSFAQANINTGVSSGTFSYSEAGYFRVRSGAVSDSNFANTSSDVANTDCIVGSSSNVLSSGKYGCNISNSLNSNYFGRFIPFGYAISNNLLTNRSTLSGTSNFTYLDESLRLEFFLIPVNSSGNTVLNYARNKFDFNNIPGFSLDASNGLTSRLNITGNTSNWQADGRLNVSLVGNIARTANPDGPFNSTRIAVKPTDSDGVTLLASSLDYDSNGDSVNDKKTIGTTNFYFGRLKVNNAIGSDIKQLPITIEAQYFNQYGFVTNTNDNLTLINNANIIRNNYVGDLIPTETSFVFPGTLVNGKQTVLLNKPSGGNGIYTGGFDIGIDLTAENKNYLKGAWTTTTNNENPKGKVVLSRKTNKQKVLLFKENYN